MTAPHKDRVAFVLRFREQFPNRPREECVKAAGRLMRNAATHRRLAADLREPWITPYRAEVTQQLMDDAVSRAKAICGPFGVVLTTPYGRAGGFQITFPSPTIEVPA